MNTLNESRVATHLSHLFESAAAADAPLRAMLRSLPANERAALMASANADYVSFYGRAKEMYLPVSRRTGALLYVMARTSSARSIVEFGTSFGLSAIHLAAALKDNGGGHLITCELFESKATEARKNLQTVGLDAFVEVRTGDALDSLSHDLPETIDLIVLDGAKGLYPKILGMLAPRLRVGGLVVADNADDSPEYLKGVRNSSDYVSFACDDEVEVSMRVERASS